MNDEKPLLLLDIDGALSPYWPARGFDFAVEEILEDVWVRIELREWLARLGEAFDLVWASTWEEEANDVFGPKLGLAALECVHFGAAGGWFLNKTLKLADVVDFVGERRAAWIDDELGEDAIVWADSVGAKLVTTRPTVGISERDVEDLLGWAKT